MYIARTPQVQRRLELDNDDVVGKGALIYKNLKVRDWIVLSKHNKQVLLSRPIIPPVMDTYRETQFEVEDIIRLGLEDYDKRAFVWFNIIASNLPDKDFLPLVDGKTKVLDLGCNAGYNTIFLKQKYGHAQGIDINPLLVLASNVNDVKCEIMDCSNLKFEDDSFSLVLAKDILEHSNRPVETIAEVHRVLCDGGVFAALIPLDGILGVDEVIKHPSFSYGNKTHVWKATLYGVLRKIFETGFTDVFYTIFSHSELFGDNRELGDNVVLVLCRKKKDVIKMPVKWLLDDPYLGAFLTLSCNSQCKYCIQRMHSDEFLKVLPEYEKNKLSAAEWLGFLNRIQKFAQHPISIIGGEPTLHKDFLEIVNGLENFFVTVTTNLSSKLFDDVNKFVSSIKYKHNFRLNTSFHPTLIDVDTFCSRIKQLRSSGIYVDQIAMVDYPLGNFKFYYDEFVKRGLVLTPQTFLGKIDGTLFPSKDVSGVTNNIVEHGITDEDLYKKGFSGNDRKAVLCNSKRFLISPNGNVYHCHYHLYSNRSPFMNIKNSTSSVVREPDYILCEDFGYCNPCDYPHVKFKEAVVEAVTVINHLMNPQAVQEFYKELEEKMKNVSGFTEFLVGLIQLLYPSENVYYDLYYNDTVKDFINNFVYGSSIYDNTNVRHLYGLIEYLSMGLPCGINIFNILDNLSMMKYVDAAAWVTASNPVIQGIAANLLVDKEMSPALHLDIGYSFINYVVQNHVDAFLME